MIQKDWVSFSMPRSNRKGLRNGSGVSDHIISSSSSVCWKKHVWHGVGNHHVCPQSIWVLFTVGKSHLAQAGLVCCPNLPSGSERLFQVCPVSVLNLKDRSSPSSPTRGPTWTGPGTFTTVIAPEASASSWKNDHSTSRCHVK